jgi:hypothetical protein
LSGDTGFFKPKTQANDHQCACETYLGQNQKTHYPPFSTCLLGLAAPGNAVFFVPELSASVAGVLHQPNTESLHRDI